MKTTNYQELKAQQGKELNEFQGIFFAFSPEQFKEGLKQVGLNEESNLKEHILSIGMGGYLLKSKKDDFSGMLKRHKQEMKDLKKDEKALLNALIYELRNHEYCITYDTTDALNALNLSINDVDNKLLKKACVEACC
jgi:hypothetical protein